MIVTFMAITYPSAISLAFTMICSSVYIGMASHQVSRYKINKVVMYIILLLMMLACVYKKYQIGKMQLEFDDFSEFKKAVVADDMLGLSTDYTPFYQYAKSPDKK